MERKQILAGDPGRLVYLRTRFGKTQAECGAELGIGQSSYARMETGNTPLKRRDRVTLAVFYGLPLDEAFPESEVATAA